MSDLTTDIKLSAEATVALIGERPSGPLDFSEASLSVVEAILDEASQYYDDPRAPEAENLVTGLGNYILEVARRNHGDIYRWMPPGQPVLVFGEPSCHIAITTWEKVRGRLSGDLADNIPFFYEGFAERARKAEPGTNVVLV